MTSPRVTEFKPGNEIDGYLIDGVIGDGAAAIIYRARDVLTNIPVVLKVPTLSVLTNGELRRRFRREARITAAIENPNVQCNLDDGRHRSSPYLVLSYAPGHNLRTEFLNRATPTSALQVADWAAQLLTILAAVHDATVLHRDIKPENIIIDQTGRLHLVDFGDASRLDRPGGRYHILSGLQGTPEYLSPEQILGRRLNGRSDLYALGVVLYEALSGHPPFEGPDTDAILLAHLRDTVPDLGSVRNDVPPWLSSVVYALLRRRVEERPANARDAHARLEARADDKQPVPPDPPLRGSPSTATARALVRFVTIVAMSLIAFSALIIVLTAALS
jgi:serine/threonine-protein kinase